MKSEGILKLHFEQCFQNVMFHMLFGKPDHNGPVKININVKAKLLALI